MSVKCCQGDIPLLLPFSLIISGALTMVAETMWGLTSGWLHGVRTVAAYLPGVSQRQSPSSPTRQQNYRVVIEDVERLILSYSIEYFVPLELT